MPRRWPGPARPRRYWGIRSLTALAQPGDTMVKASSADPSVAVHAVRAGNGGRTDAAPALDHDFPAEAQVGGHPRRRPSPAPTPSAATPTAAAPVAPASDTIGARAQASAAGVPVGRPAQSDTDGGLAATGMRGAVTYSTLGGLLAFTAGSVLVLRRRRSRASHGR